MTSEAEQRPEEKRDEDFSTWYIDTVLRAKLADYTPVRGSIIAGTQDRE